MELEGFTKNERKFIQSINKPHSKIAIICGALGFIYSAYLIIDFLQWILKNHRLLIDANTQTIAGGFFILGVFLILVGMSIRDRFLKKNY